MEQARNPYSDLSGAIIAGGKATRMGGVVKPLVAVDGVAMVDRALVALASVTDDIWISVSGQPEWAERRRKEHVRVVSDGESARGPLAGIARVLAASQREWVLVVGGDMPWLSPQVLAWIAQAALAADAPIDVVCPRVGGFAEPLLTAYRKRAARSAASAAAAGWGPARWVAEQTVHWLDEGEFRRHDPNLRSLANINTLQDLQNR